MIGVTLARVVSRARLVLGCCLLLSASWGTPASAAAKTASAPKSKPETADQKAAHGLLERGQAELKQGRADLARDSLNAAKQLADSFPVEDALADATLALGQPVEASTVYRDFIEKNRAALSAEQVSISDAKLAELAAASAQLQLQVSEADADVQLDGVSVGHSPLPAALIVDPGDHQITLSKPGFVVLTQHFTLPRGLNAFAMTLIPEVVVGQLRVSSNSPGVIELLLNDQAFALLPWEGALPIGKVKLLARSNDRTSPAVEVSIERDVTKSIVLELEPNEGTVNVSGAGRGVQIVIDGRKVGSQTWQGRLPVGTHHLTLSRPGFLSQERELLVQTGSIQSIAAEHWTPVPDDAPKPKDNRGLYVRLDLAAAFGKGSDGIRQECAANDPNNRPQCAAHAPFGGSLGLRVGYRFKWIAPELFGMATFAASFVRLRASEYQPDDTNDTSTMDRSGRKITSSSATAGPLAPVFASPPPPRAFPPRPVWASACSRKQVDMPGKPRARL